MSKSSSALPRVPGSGERLQGRRKRMQAYVLIQTEAEDGIAERLLGVPEVVAASDLAGPYDAIALIRTSSERTLLGRVVGAIRELPGVIRALPAPLARSADDDETAGGRAA
jgi:hypothetical protein